MPSLPPDLAANLPRTADGRPVHLVPSESSGRALEQVLKPGEVVTARVVERFAEGSYLFTIRGRNLIAASQQALQRDSTARFQVVGHGDGLLLRLLGGGDTSRDAAATSERFERLPALGLPSTAAAAQLLAAFEDAGAPLQPGRLAAALQAAEQTPPAERAALIASHARLAAAGLAATPALLQLADRAGAGHLPQVGQQMQQLIGQPQLQMLLSPAQRQALGLPSASQPLPAGAMQPSPGSMTNTQSGAPAPMPANTAAPAAAPPSATAGPVTTAANAASPSPAATGPGATVLGQTTAPPGSSTPRAPTTVPADLISAGAAHRAVLSSTQQAGEEAAMQRLALQASGLRPAGGEEADDAARAATQAANARPVVQELVQLARAFAPAGGPDLAPLAREQLADSILPPRDLQDYDQLVPLLLPGRQQAPPARLAISRRSTAGGDEATFVRVDIELSHLGPLSLRLAGMGHGHLTITILATPSALPHLQQALPELQADLEAQGLDAGIRLSDFDGSVAGAGP